MFVFRYCARFSLRENSYEDTRTCTRGYVAPCVSDIVLSSPSARPIFLQVVTTTLRSVLLRPAHETTILGNRGRSVIIERAGSKHVRLILHKSVWPAATEIFPLARREESTLYGPFEISQLRSLADHVRFNVVSAYFRSSTII